MKFHMEEIEVGTRPEVSGVGWSDGGGMSDASCALVNAQVPHIVVLSSVNLHFTTYGASTPESGGKDLRSTSYSSFIDHPQEGQVWLSTSDRGL